MKPKISKLRHSGLEKVDLELPLMTFRASAFVRAMTGSHLSGLQTYSREQLIAKIENEFGKFDESIDKEKLVFWRALISNRMLDSHYTRMSKSSLQNYAQDLSNLDVVFQDMHSRRHNGFGRAIVGQYIEDGTPPAGVEHDDYFPAVVGDFYSYRGLEIGGVKVDDFYIGLQTNILNDVSIGFKETPETEYTCSICNDDYWGWDCRHIAGYEYEVSNGDTDDPADNPDAEPETVLCYVWIENARLSEVSAVYDGSTPFATFIKAEREIRAGRMLPEVENFLNRKLDFERSKNTQLFLENKSQNNSDSRGETDPPNTKKEGKTQMANTDNNEDTVIDLTPQIRSIGKAFGLEKSDSLEPDAIVRELKTLAPSLLSDSKEFQNVRTKAIDAALKQKVRAEAKEDGEEMTDERKESVRTMLKNCDLNSISEFETEWRTQGDANFKSRKTEDANNETNKGGDEGEGGDEKRKLSDVVPENSAKILERYQ